MTHQSPNFPIGAMADAGGQVAQLQQVLVLVGQIADRAGTEDDGSLDQGARISVAYGNASPIVQHRFDLLIAETAIWAATGVEALLTADNPHNRPRAAAARLADELSVALKKIGRVLGL
jgi:hypothetical protein